MRRLSVDVANLSGQLAVMQSGLEFVRAVAAEVQPDSWGKEMADDENGHPEMCITLRGEQVDSVLRLLAALDTLG